MLYFDKFELQELEEEEKLEQVFGICITNSLFMENLCTWNPEQIQDIKGSGIYQVLSGTFASPTDIKGSIAFISNRNVSGGNITKVYSGGTAGVHKELERGISSIMFKRLCLYNFN